MSSVNIIFCHKVGINLTQANRVFLMEPAMNPALEAQAIGRVYRLGQRKSVQVIRMRVEDTIETRMVDMLSKKFGEAKKPDPERDNEDVDTDYKAKSGDVAMASVGHMDIDKAKLVVNEFDALFGV